MQQKKGQRKANGKKKRGLEDYAANVFNKEYAPHNCDNKWDFEVDGDGRFVAESRPILRIEGGEIYDPEDELDDEVRRAIINFQTGISQYMPHYGWLDVPNMTDYGIGKRNESLARRVTKGVIRKLRRLN